MIPKKIHYCWLSGEEIPHKLKKCIASWKKIMPNYEIIKWDSNRFDVESNPFVKDAISSKKWAFAADFIRLFALHQEGGIYLDSDVLVKKKFDKFLTSDFFSSVEYHPRTFRKNKTHELINADGSSKSAEIKRGLGIQAAVMASVKKHPYLKDCLNYYKSKVFVNEGIHNFTAPDVFASIAEKYGFKFNDEQQHLKNNMLILPSEIFAGTVLQETNNSYAVHLCAASWREQNNQNSLLVLLKRIVKNLLIIKNNILNRYFRN